jgi:hypothetical protein
MNEFTVPPNMEKDYIASGGIRCPFCLDQDIEGRSVEINAGRASQTISCKACGAEWEDHYTLSNIDITHGPDKKTESMEIGDRVRWIDPDDGLCSGEGTITYKSHGGSGDDDIIYSLRMDDGGEVEAWEHELEKIASPEEETF